MTFCKEERLCSRRTIDKLYAEGHRLMAFPFSVQWIRVDRNTADPPCQIMIVAPKRRFRHAVDRNRVRRLTRECYRMRKGPFYEFLQNTGINIALSLVYVHNEIPTFEQLGHKMDKLMLALEHDISAKSES